MKGRPIDWHPEEIAWVAARADWPRRELWQAFCGFWQRDGITLQAFKAMCKRERIMTGRDGRLQKGNVPPNKGRKGHAAPGSEKGWFKKGQRPSNKQAPGYEMIDFEGYVQICVAEPNPWTGAPTRMIRKHRWLWEQANGPVPKGHALKCLDGNRQNTDPANWVCVPRGLLPRLNGVHGRDYDAAPAEVKPLILATALLAQAAHDARKGKRE